MEASLIASAETSVITVGPSLFGGIWAKCGYDLLDKDGNPIRSWEGPSRSFMRNFGKFVRQLLYVPDDTNEEYVNDAGVAKAFNIIDSSISSTGGVVVGTAEIAMGSSDTAVASDQYNLQGSTFISPAVTTSLLVENDAEIRWKHESLWLNTGGSVTIKEIGLFAHLRQGNVASQNYRTMMMRDVVSDVVVANGETVVGRYTFTAAV